jgi:anaerobic dimethyl sulfoxide reductase subunit B
MKQITFSFDISRCSACLACVVACLDQNDLVAENVAFRHVTVNEEGSFPDSTVSSLSLACNHCGDAPCLAVCPTGAIFKLDENGIVDLNSDMCMGCRSCFLVCPFGAPRFSENGKMSKCNLCHVRLAHDLLPACVLVCPTQALKIGTSEDLSKEKAEKASLTILKNHCNPNE